MLEANKPFKVVVYCRLGNDPEQEKKQHRKEDIQMNILNERLKSLYNLSYKRYTRLFDMRYDGKNKELPLIKTHLVT